MKEEKDKLRDLMQGVFQNYEVAPNPEDWNRIEKTLSERKKRRVLPWIIWASAACLLTLLVLYTGGILKHSSNSTIQTAVNLNKTNKSLAGNKNNNTLSAQKTVNTAISTSGKVKNEKTEESIVRNAKTGETNKALIAANQIKQLTPNVLNGKTLTVANEQITKLLNNNSAQSNQFIHTINPRQIGFIVLSSTKRDKLKDFSYSWLKSSLAGKNPSNLLATNASSLKFKSFSLSSNSGFIPPTSSKEMMSYQGAFASQLASNMYLGSVKVFDNSYLSSINIGNLFHNNSQDYIPPVTFGMNINLSLENNWSIETGLQCTRLQSSGTISINSSNAIQIKTSFGYKVDENLYYLGVPVIVNYNLSKSRKTLFYLSAGLSIDKGIIAKYKATPEDNFPGMLPIYSQNAIPGLQFSINTGIGITYKFIPHFELFGQPSIGYYFKNGRTTSIYSQHPKILNLRTGIRYTIK